MDIINRFVGWDLVYAVDAVERLNSQAGGFSPVRWNDGLAGWLITWRLEWKTKRLNLLR